MIRLQYILKLRKSLETFREMMIDRGCEDPILSNDDHYKDWVQDIESKTIKGDDGFFHRKFVNYRDKDSEVHCMICVVRKAKLAQLRQEMKNVKSNFLIVLSLFPMSSNNEKFLSSKIHPSMRIQLFYSHQLQINITKHRFVPKHRQMSDDEKTELFRKMKIDESNLIEFPLITRKDPIVLYYDFPIGSLIEIERHSLHIGNTKYYRWIR